MKSRSEFIAMHKVGYLWFDASPYMGIGYSMGLAEGGHKTTGKHTSF